MKLLLQIIGIVLTVGVVLFVLIGFIRTSQTKRSDDQNLFSAGRVPAPLPDGFYAGSAEPVQGGWLGKIFIRDEQRGINRFRSPRGDEREAYPFATSVGKGLRDTDKEVLKIDYNIDGNPFWLRPALDEVVEIEPGLLLGKLHFRVIPGYPFTMTFFRLKKP